MNRAEKDEAVSRLRSRLADSPDFYLTDFTGLSVKLMTDLRRRFRSQGVDYVIVKNTLALRALREASIDLVDDAFTGPTAFVFARDEPMGAAKIIADFQKEAGSRPTVKVGVIEGKRVTPEEFQVLAALPSRDELLAQAAGVMQAPMAAFVGALSGVLNQFVGVLDALNAQRAASPE